MSMSDETREALSQRTDDNPSSWRWTIAYFEYVTALPDPRWPDQCLPLLRLTTYLADSDVAQKFRAGQSVSDLVISTKGKDGLHWTDQRVKVGSAWKDEKFRVEYWRGGESGDLVEGYVVTESEIIDTLMPLLDRLWSETGGHTS